MKLMLSSLQNESYLKQFNFVRPTFYFPPLQPANVNFFPLLSVARPPQQGGIVASMPAGSLMGALAVTQLADRIGRKKTIILSGLIW